MSVLLSLFLTLHLWQSGQAHTSLSLNHMNWTLSNETTRVPGSVPGGVYSDLLKAGLLTDGDVYYGENDVKYRWVGYANWTYSTTVPEPILASLRKEEKIFLVFEGVDTVSSVSVNGLSVGNTDNMFVKYSFDVTNAVQHSPSLSLSLNFSSPVLSALSAYNQQALSYPVPPKCVPPEYHGECHANHIRKMQASFGWDWGPAFPSVGIWKPVSLVGWSSLLMKDILLSYSTNETFPAAPNRSFEPSWTLNLTIFCESATEDTSTGGTVSVFLNGTQLLSEDVTPPPSSHFKLRYLISIPKGTVQLWWPNELGNQPLYNFTIIWKQNNNGETSSKSRLVGFRTIELDQSYLDQSNKTLGRHYRILVNNVPVFLRGSNWIPSHALSEAVTNASQLELLQDAAKSHQNTIRVWGGGVYETDYFYEIADRLGIMIWQDMMFACSMYPVKESVLKSVKNEVMTQVTRLQHHPSIIVWAGNNENEAALRGNWYGTSFDFERYKKDYVTLYVDTIRRVVRDLDRERPFIVSSPSNGLESEEEGYIAANPYSDLYGDVHVYNYLSNGWNWTIFPAPRMATEFGYQSWPSFRTLSSISPASLWHIHSSLMDHRQHHLFGNVQMGMQITTHMIWPDSSDNVTAFKHYLYLTQVHQAMAVKTEAERYRRLLGVVDGEGRGLTTAALYWQLNDIWQGASWSSIEFGGRWKILHYFAQHFFRPVLVSPYLNGCKLEVSLVNDRPFALTNTSIEVVLRDYQRFEAVSTDVVTVPWIAPNSASVVFTSNLHDGLRLASYCGSWLHGSADSCFVTVSAKVEGNTIENFLLLGEPKDASVNEANVLMSSVEGPCSDGRTYNITITSDQVALFVWLETDTRGVFSDNGFLMTGPTKRIEFQSREPTSAEELLGSIEVTTLTDTYSVLRARVQKFVRKFSTGGT